MKTMILSIIILICLPAMAFSGQWEGSIQGLTCAMHGKVCPSGMEDPYIAIEDNYVFYTGKDTWYLLPNVSKRVLVRHLNDPVRVIGTKNAKHPAIDVEEIQIKKNGEWQTAWSKQLQKEADQMINTWGM
ncbi:MAG TPA: hypothetical protein VKN73_07500 [Desulfosalsimonadaceae bacterium]|nr:hypothetical protein [Desulfosalsimonadaceae bacterium]